MQMAVSIFLIVVVADNLCSRQVFKFIASAGFVDMDSICITLERCPYDQEMSQIFDWYL